MLDPCEGGYGCTLVPDLRFLGKDELTRNPVIRFLFGRIQMIFRTP
jgi:1-acyl-sn-glycerol-3-phosphate acyltransferase